MRKLCYADAYASQNGNKHMLSFEFTTFVLPRKNVRLYGNRSLKYKYYSSNYFVAQYVHVVILLVVLYILWFIRGNVFFISRYIQSSVYLLLLLYKDFCYFLIYLLLKKIVHSYLFPGRHNTNNKPQNTR